MTFFTDRENDELLSYNKYLKECRVVPVDPLEIELQAPVDCMTCPLRTAAEAILLNDMFASFLSSGESGYVIAVSGGFGPGNMYHIVGAGNTGQRGVRRPSDELCTALERACNGFIFGSTMPLNPDNMSPILVASLDICHAQVAHRLTQINPVWLNTSMLHGQGLQVYSTFHWAVAALMNDLERWKGLEPQEKTEVATSYARLLIFTCELWDGIKDFGSIQSHRELRPFYELNTIMKGLQLLRRFPRNTRVVFDWPQGPINGDPSRCQPTNANTALWRTVIEDFIISESAIGDHELKIKMGRKWKAAVGETQWETPIRHTDCQLHCEIYLALYILFSESNVRFHSFLIEEGTRMFAIGCSKASCLGCWDMLLGLFRQDSFNHPTYMCRTRRSSGKCYATWGLTPHVGTLPPSLCQAVTGPRQTQMLNALNDALKYTHQGFKQRVVSEMLRK